MADVHVIGAGPAGLISSITALRENHDVCLSEEHQKPELFKSCSGLISAEGVKEMDRYIPTKKTIINKIKGAKIFFERGHSFVIKKDLPVAYVCDREEIDRLLAEKAEEEGVVLYLNEKIRGNFRADNIIGADGPFSSVASYFSFPRIDEYVITLKKVSRCEVPDPSLVEVFISTKFRGFFGWCIPHNEEFCEVGVGVALPENPYPPWKEMAKLKGIQEGNPTGAIIPLKTRKRTAKRFGNKNVLLVGDAAGQTQATSGGGIVFGMWCAEIAGRNVLSPQWYELEWRARYGNDLFIHRKIREYLNSLDSKGLVNLGKRLSRLGIDRYLSLYGNMDKPSAFLKPGMIAHLLSFLSISVFPSRSFFR